MKTRIISAVLAVLTLLSLMGCAGSSGQVFSDKVCGSVTEVQFTAWDETVHTCTDAGKVAQILEFLQSLELSDYDGEVYEGAYMFTLIGADKPLGFAVTGAWLSAGGRMYTADNCSDIDERILEIMGLADKY